MELNYDETDGTVSFQWGNKNIYHLLLSYYNKEHIQCKDGPIVEDNALRMNPNSVYLYMTSFTAVLVLNSNNQH